MNNFQLTTSTRFEKSLRKLDPQNARRLLSALYGLEAMEDPTKRCKALTGPLAGLWRLRVGDYRVILDIRRGECVVVALDVDHRSNVSDDPAVA